MKQHSQTNLDRIRVLRTTTIVVSVLVIAFFATPFLRPVSVAFITPILSGQTVLQRSLSWLPSIWQEKAELQDIITTLQQKLLKTPDTQAELRRLQEENSRLRQILHIPDQKKVAASVIGRPPSLPFDMIIIDQGSDAGIELHAPVYSNDSEVIGITTQVTDRSAHTTLFTSPGFTTPVFLPHSNILTTIEGLGGGVARVTVPQNIPLSFGDVVVLPSIHPGTIGTISTIEQEATNPQQYGYIVPTTPTQSLWHVAVGTPQQIGTSTERIELHIQELQELLALPADISVPIVQPTSTTSSSSTTTTGTTTNPQSL